MKEEKITDQGTTPKEATSGSGSQGADPGLDLKEATSGSGTEADGGAPLGEASRFEFEPEAGVDYVDVEMALAKCLCGLCPHRKVCTEMDCGLQGELLAMLYDHVGDDCPDEGHEGHDALSNFQPAETGEGEASSSAGPGLHNALPRYRQNEFGRFEFRVPDGVGGYVFPDWDDNDLQVDLVDSIGTKKIAATIISSPVLEKDVDSDGPFVKLHGIDLSEFFPGPAEARIWARVRGIPVLPYPTVLTAFEVLPCEAATDGSGTEVPPTTGVE